MEKRCIFLILSLCLLLIVVQGCAQENEVESEKSILVVATHMDLIDGWDPYLSTAWGSTLAEELVYNNLFYLDENVDSVPDLVESWDLVDELVYEFKLRNNVKWHDGFDFTAEDVKFSIERLQDPDVGSIYSSKVDSIERVEVVDDYTCRFHLKYHDGTLISNLSSVDTAIVPKHIFDEGGDLKQNPIGTGPFILVEQVPDSHITFKKNPSYFEEGLPLVDGVEMKIIKEDTMKIAALRAKQVDMIINMDEMQHLPTLNQEEGLNVVSNPSVNTVVLFANTENEPFNDKRVRKAISMAIDREEVLSLVGFGEGKLSGPIPISQQFWSLPEAELLEAYRVDVEGAKQLLSEAGYPNGFETTIQVNPTYPYTIPAGQVIQRHLEKIGIKAVIQTLEWGIVQDNTRKGDFDLQIRPAIGRPDPDAYTYELFHSDASRNYSRFKNDKADRLMVEGRQTMDLDERQQIYFKIQRILLDESPYIYLYVMNEVDVLQPYVKGYRQLPTKDRNLWKEIRIER